MGDPVLFQHLFYNQKNDIFNYFIPEDLSYYLCNLSCQALALDQKINFNFSKFLIKFKDFYPNNIPPSSEFLQWFIGFSEGEGSFILAKRGDLSFVITQSSSDINVLNYIKKNLSFGKIIVQSSKQKTHRFIIQDFINLYLICLLFNGNMVFPTRKARFLSFISFFNEKLLKRKTNLQTILPIYNCILPTLNDAWLAGITDGEGCFTVSLLSNSPAFRIRYILTQKWETNKYVLEEIINLFGVDNNYIKIGNISPHSAKNVFECRINGLKNCEKIIPYFDRFTLQTKKKESYCKWKFLLNRLSKQDHLDLNLRLELISIAKTLNKI